MPIVNRKDTVWDRGTDDRYQWAAGGVPLARPLTSGGLIFNIGKEWWERNGISWQPDKKTKGGRQTAVDLSHLGVVVQSTASRLFGKAKSLLQHDKTTQENAKVPKEALQGAPTVIAEVSKPKCVAKAKTDLEAKTHVLYTPRQSYRIINSLSRKSCRHPSTCTLHQHIPVHVPQEISAPILEEPEKIKAHESGFRQKPCQYEGHQHLSHEEDPCFGDPKEAGKLVQIQEDAFKQVMELAATGANADELERIWQEEEGRERQEEMLMSYSTGKENRPASVSAHTLFRNAARNLQNISQESPQKANLRGGMGKQRPPRFPLSWRIKEWFTPTRMVPVLIGRTDSSDENSSRDTRRRRIRHRVSDGQEFGYTAEQWTALRPIQFGQPSRSGSCSRRRTRTVHDQYGNTVECDVVGTMDSRRRRHGQSDSDSNEEDIRRLRQTASYGSLVSRSRSQHTSRAGSQGRHSGRDGPPHEDDPRASRLRGRSGRRRHSGSSLSRRLRALFINQGPCEIWRNSCSARERHEFEVMGTLNNLRRRRQGFHRRQQCRSEASYSDSDFYSDSDYDSDSSDYSSD